MAFSGSQVSDFSNILIRMPVGPIIRTIEHNNAAFQLFQRDVNRLVPSTNADYWTIRYYDGLDITAGARTETGDMPLPGKHTTSEGRVYPKEVSGAIGWTQWELNLLRNDPNAFADRYADKIDAFLPGYQWLHQVAQLGDGTMRLGRVSSYNASTRVVTIDSNFANFGISDTAAMLMNYMNVDIFTVADISGTSAWTQKATRVRVDQLNRAASSTTATFRITALDSNPDSEITAAPADGDFIFAANAVDLGDDLKFNGWNYPIGLHAIVDKDGSTGQEFHNGSSDAYNGSWHGSTIQNRSRTSVDIYRATISRAGDRGGTSGTAQETSWDEVADVIRDLDEGLSVSKPNSKALLAHPAIVDWLGMLTRNTKNVQVTLGQGEAVLPGLSTGEFLITSTGRIPMFRLPMLPKSALTIVNWDDLYRIDVEPMGPVAYQPGGPMQFPSPGTRNRTFESWMVWGGANWFTRCDRMARIEDINRDYV